MPYLVGQQWFDLNSQRNYPLVDFAIRIDTSDSFTLPNDLIVDARLAAPPSLDSTKFYISQLSAFGAGLVLTIAVDGTGAVASVTVPLVSFQEFSSYEVAGLPGYPDVGGSMTFGAAGSVIAAGSGVYDFDLEATRLLPTVIFPATPSVTSITVIDAFGGTQRLTGAVVITAGDNAGLIIDGQSIDFSMETGVLIEDPCPCTDTGGRARTAVRSINGVTADDDGNIEIIPVGCVELTAATNQLKLSDSCAQPCCGAAELEVLATAARDIQSVLATQANKSAELEAVLRALENYLVK